MFVFDAPPQAFDKHIVDSFATIALPCLAYLSRNWSYLTSHAVQQAGEARLPAGEQRVSALPQA